MTIITFLQRFFFRELQGSAVPSHFNMKIQFISLCKFIRSNEFADEKFKFIRIITFSDIKVSTLSNVTEMLDGGTVARFLPVGVLLLLLNLPEV